jgi:thiamine-phosphate pyrophosphorylase
MKPFDLSLYLVTDSTGLTEEAFLRIVEEALSGGVTCLQLREKDKTGRQLFALALKVKELADSYKVPLLIDDRLDVALAVDAAGVHLGEEDLPLTAARSILGGAKIIGATAKTVEAARAAQAAGADYLGVGAVYPTTTKVKTVLTPVSALREITAAVDIPVAAIGGLTPDNLSVLYGSGIAGVCAASALMKSPRPAAAARRMREAFAVLRAPRACIKTRP